MADKPAFATWVDFNGTLVKHVRGAPLWDAKGELVIGQPVRDMVARVKRHMVKGRAFVIKSALVSSASTETQRRKAREAIGDWCVKWLGKRLEVTAECRPEFIDTWDDKCRQVVRNEGRFVDEQTGETDGVDEQVQGAGTARDTSRSRRHERESGGNAGTLRAGTGEAPAEFGEWDTWDEDGG